MKTLFVYENEMPKNCMDCRLADDYSDFPNIYCNVTGEMVNDWDYTDEARHKNCPLRVLKPDSTPKA